MKTNFFPPQIVVIVSVLMVTFTSLRAEGPGSVFVQDTNARGLSLFSDPIASQKGDLITVVVNLASTAAATKALNTSKSASINSGTITSELVPDELARNFNFALNGASNTHAGSGDLTDTETMTTTFTGVIVEALPNDTYKIEARRSYDVGKEKTELILTGLIRRQDIGAGNTINSTRVANVQIEQKGSGALSRSRNKGWLQTIYEFINPF